MCVTIIEDDVGVIALQIATNGDRQLFNVKSDLDRGIRDCSNWAWFHLYRRRLRHAVRKNERGWYPPWTCLYVDRFRIGDGEAGPLA